MSFSCHAAAVYIGAHPDDIELLMGRNAGRDVSANTPTVFILTTAGDAGYGTGGLNIQGTPYYRARLDGHEAAIRFWLGLYGNMVQKTERSTETIGAYAIEKATFGNVTIYNLNLPDGHGDGGGFPTTGHQSLTRLLAGKIPTIQSIDERNTYTAAQLRLTIRRLIRQQNPAPEAVRVHFPEPLSAKNLNDHPDHVATGMLAAAALAEDPAFACLGVVKYQGYNNANLPTNMLPKEVTTHIGAYGALTFGVVNSGSWSKYDLAHTRLLGRQYVTFKSRYRCAV